MSLSILGMNTSPVVSLKSSVVKTKPFLPFGQNDQFLKFASGGQSAPDKTPVWRKWVTRIGLPATLVASAIGISGCTDPVKDAEKQWNQIAQQNVDNKVVYLSQQHAQSNESVKVWAFNKLASQEGYDTLKATWAIEGLRSKSDSAYKESKAITERMLAEGKIKNETFKPHLQQLVNLAPGFHQESYVTYMFIPDGNGGMTMIPQFHTDDVRDGYTKAYEQTEKELFKAINR